jgi:hypothetical protein
MKKIRKTFLSDVEKRVNYRPFFEAIVDKLPKISQK